MNNLNRFALSKHTGPYETWPKDSELIKEGVLTGAKIPGYVLEAQYEHTDGLLFVTSWDCPYEEAQTFLLLSHELQVLGEKTIDGAYASVWIEGHEPINEETVVFHCNDNLDLLVTIDSASELRVEKRYRRK